MKAEHRVDRLISVVIPTRHRNDLLALCLERLAPGVQTLDAKRYEVIVSDDGRDTTAESLIREQFPWARWSEGPAKGPASNRNHGARQTRGNWVAFTDDDCLPSPQWLESFHEAILGGGDVFEGRTTCAAGLTSLFQQAPINENGGVLWSCNMMVRRDYFERLQGFDESFPCPHLEDVDFRERVYGLGDKICFVTEALIDHPPRPSNFGKKLGAMQETEFLFYYKTGHHKPYLLQHLRRMVSLRVQLLRNHSLSRESVTALLYLVPELVYVTQHGREWQKKYRDKYRNTSISYAPDLVTRSCQW